MNQNRRQSLRFFILIFLLIVGIESERIDMLIAQAKVIDSYRIMILIIFQFL